MTDPISDLLSRIRNAQQSQHAEVRIPFSQIKLEIVKILYQEGFLAAYRMTTDQGKKWLELSLRYVGKKQPIITGLKRVSRPGRRVYLGFREIRSVRGGLGFSILSTSKGILTEQAAREAKLGGEILCTVW